MQRPHRLIQATACSGEDTRRLVQDIHHLRMRAVVEKRRACRNGGSTAETPVIDSHEAGDEQHLIEAAGCHHVARDQANVARDIAHACRG